MNQDRMNHLLDTVHSGEKGDCHCGNCRPDLEKGPATWADNITAQIPDSDEIWCGKTACDNAGVQWVLSPMDLFPKGDEGQAQGAVDKKGNLWILANAHSPVKTIVHELAHWNLGHCAILGTENATDPPIHAMAEVEAEATALLVADRLGRQEEVKLARQYIDNFLMGAIIPMKIRERIIKTAQKIFDQGRINATKKAA